MITRAYAKINLGLRILHKRDDGYHDIETVFHRINLYDEITLESSSAVSLSCSRHDLPTDDSNLCVRAAALLQKTLNIRQGVHLTLRKNIPVGAGLGGGSSDAAAVLTTLPAWWNETLDNKTLSDLALQLGADVPYFLNPGTAYATGKGEQLDYFAFDVPYWILVVYPGFHISTTWAYENVQTENGKGKRENLDPPIGRLKSEIPLKNILLENIKNPRMLMNLLHNDFEALVLRTHGEVAKVKKALYDAGSVFAQMSGSGSSVYGLFRSETETQAAGDELRKRYQVFVTEPDFAP